MTDSPAQTPARPHRAWYRRPAALMCAATMAASALVIGVPALAASTATATTASDTTVARSGTTVWAPSIQRSPRETRGESTQTTTMTDAVVADAAQSTGVVLIDTVLGYDDSSAAGTGLVLTSDGLVLTNNHVVSGSTEIHVTDASTGITYTATVVGTDAEDDIALLQLDDASGLTTVTVDDDAETVGDTATAVGNADGGGVLMAAVGEITALESSVTTASSGTAEGETLDGMIEIVADVVSGDSGGAVLDAEGEVIGVTTAASNGTSPTTAYAIPIEDALAIVDQILAGDESDGVALGYPAFLGVQLASTTTAGSGNRTPTTSTTAGATIAGVLADTPAATLGLAAGDTITAIDDRKITDATALGEALADYAPGDTVTLAWTDAAGATRTGSLTLATGPAA